jgi:transcriptional regulator with XRE-family HTH domain
MRPEDRRKAGIVTEDPPVRRRLVGGALRRYRENVGYALEDAARVLECDRSKISRIETGQRGIRPKELRELLTEYGVPPSEQLALVSIASRGGQHSWWHPYADTLSDAYLDYVIMESAASEIMTYEAQLIPDLLQTDEYARAIAAAEPSYVTDQQREDAVAARAMRRQAMLGGSRKITVVLGEGALHQVVGGADVLAGQIAQAGRGRSRDHAPGTAVLGGRARRRGQRVPGHPQVSRRAEPGRGVPGGAVRRRLPGEPGRRRPVHPRLRAPARGRPQPGREHAPAPGPGDLGHPRAVSLAARVAQLLGHGGEFVDEILNVLDRLLRSH